MVRFGCAVSPQTLHVVPWLWPISTNFSLWSNITRSPHKQDSLPWIILASLKYFLTANKEGFSTAFILMFLLFTLFEFNFTLVLIICCVCCLICSSTAYFLCRGEYFSIWLYIESLNSHKSDGSSLFQLGSSTPSSHSK